MKKIISFLSILLLGVICSACVNNFAVHELNKLAVQYLENGDTKSAISRLESSIDLDNTVWDTRYNLAVAYLKESNCEKALENIEQAIKLSDNSNLKNLYYTQGVAYDCMADSFDEADDDDDNIIKKPELSQEEINNETVKYLKLAIKSYEKYLENNETATDIEDIKSQIENDEKKINELNPVNLEQ